MIQALGITLREAVEAILVVFIMAAYLDRTGRTESKKWVYTGAAAAVLTSIILAVILRLFGADPENEAVESIMLFAAGGMVGSLVIWMWRKAKYLKQELEKKVQRASSWFALALIAFFMVLREGVETVFFLQSLLLAGSTLAENFLGGLIGIGLAVILGIVFLRGTTQINLPRFFKITSVILAILVIKLFAGGFGELIEMGLITVNTTAVQVIDFLTASSTGAMLIGAMIVVMMGMVIYDIAKTRPSLAEELNSRQREKLKLSLVREKITKITMTSIFLAGVLVVLISSMFL
ncbi:MAG: FTR1 family iron permease [Spirochaetota bacterium]